MFRVTDMKPEPEPEPEPPVCAVDDVPCPTEFIQQGGDVIVPVDRTFSLNELTRQLGAAGLDYSLATDTIDWWQRIGHFEIVRTPAHLQELYGPTRYRTVRKGIAEAREIKEIIMHKLPKTTYGLYTGKRGRGTKWYVSQKGGLYGYLQKTFGWTMSEAVEYFDTKLRDDSEWISTGYYEVPKEIPIETTRLEAATEPKPVPVRLLAALRWEGQIGGGFHDKKAKEADKRRTGKYGQQHEINAFIRLPRSLDKDRLDQAIADLIQIVLKDTGVERHKREPYPDLREILGNWHDAICTGNTTEKKHPDGYWVQEYGGAEGPRGEVDPEPVWKESGVMD